MRGKVETNTIAKSVEDLEPSQINLFDVIISPFRLLFKYHQLFVPSGAVAVGGVLWVIVFLGTDAILDSPPSNVLCNVVLSILGIVVIITPIAIIIMGVGWIIAMMREIKESEKTTLKSSFSILMENRVSIILGSLLAGLVVMVGVICLVIPGIILAVALCCTVPAIVMHGFNAIEGLKASWKFCWQGRNFWLLLALLILLIPALLLSILPVIGAIGVLILSLWISYTYMEYVGSKEVEVSGMSELEERQVIEPMVGETTARKMIKVILPLMEGYAFPNICPGCLRPADISVEVKYTRVKHYVVVKKFETTTIEVPTCRDCAGKFNGHGMITQVALLGGVMMGVLIAVSGNHGAGLTFMIITIVLSIVYARLYNPLGFFLKVNRKKGVAEFSIKNPRYAELFEEMNNMHEKEVE